MADGHPSRLVLSVHKMVPEDNRKSCRTEVIRVGGEVCLSSVFIHFRLERKPEPYRELSPFSAAVVAANFPRLPPPPFRNVVPSILNYELSKFTSITKTFNFFRNMICVTWRKENFIFDFYTNSLIRNFVSFLNLKNLFRNRDKIYLFIY